MNKRQRKKQITIRHRRFEKANKRFCLLLKLKKLGLHPGPFGHLKLSSDISRRNPILERLQSRGRTNFGYALIKVPMDFSEKLDE